MRLRFRRSPVALVATGVLLVAAAPAVAAASPPAAPPPTPTSATRAGTTGQAPMASGKPIEITLVTGDRVRFDAAAGATGVTVTAAKRSDGSTTGFQAYPKDGHVYVVPDDVLPYLSSGALDEGLFDVSYLAANGYGDADRTSLPVIAEYPANTRRAATASVAGLKPRRQLSSVNGVALDVPKGKGAQFWKSVQSPKVKPAEAAQQEKLQLAGGVSRLVLDRVAHVTLNESVPLIGAPQAWAAGYDGTGVKVAVLDTGADFTHPDLAGQIAAKADFSGASADAVDHHGHGTHVASTIAGTGAAAQDTYRGVAPGASLLVGKVCNDSGSCQDSDIIAGMQWAAEQGADVVSISIGGDAPATYPDPMSQTIDELTASTGTLFVVAAGNSGADETIETPGVAAAALTVAATDKEDQLASFSSRGPLWYSDRSLKPDIAAPGVSITAARAAGTTMGTPANDRYTTASGTSMATPHVSGAAAILAQQHPDWTGPQLKAALMSTAKDVGRTVFEQGAGRLDVARATAQHVFAVTPNVDPGILERDRQAVSQTVTYRNTGTDPVTLTLTPSLTSGSGGQVPAGAITVDPTLTVPAGGTASATVTVDAPALAPGLYRGAVVATDPTGVVVRVPIGFQIEPQSFPVRINILGHDGQVCGTTDGYACNLITGAGYVGVDNGNTGGFTNSQPVRLGAGHYFFHAIVGWIDRDTHRPQQALVMLDGVDVTGPTTVVLDASKAQRMTVETPKPSEAATEEMGVIRSDSDSGAYGGVMSLAAYGTAFWVTPTTKAQRGELLFHHTYENIAPLITMAAGSKSAPALHPRYGNFTPDVVKFAGTRNLDVVDLGVVHGQADPASQIPDDLSMVKGKLVLVEQDPDYHDGTWNCLMFQEYVDALADAGAAGVVGFLQNVCDADTVFQVIKPKLPAVTVPPAEGLALRKLLRTEGRLSIRVTGQPDSPYQYHLKFYQDGEVTADQHYTATEREFERINRDYHAEQPVDIENNFHQFTDDDRLSIQWLFTFRGPGAREEYVGPVNQPGQLATNHPGREMPDGRRVDGQYVEWYHSLSAGSTRNEEWFGGPDVPGSFEELHPELQLQLFACGACRQGDLFSPFLPLTATVPDVYGYYTEAGQSQRLHLYRGDEEVPPTPLLGVYTGYTLPAGEARYRLTQELEPVLSSVYDEFNDRRVSTEWEFTSSRVTKDNRTSMACPGALAGTSTEACAVQPLVYLRYNLNLDLDNSTGPGTHQIQLHAYHELAAQPTPEISSIEAWVSYDGEKTWRAAPTGALDGGTVTATLPSPGKGGVPVSLRVKVTDAAGNTVTQTVHEAYGVR